MSSTSTDYRTKIRVNAPADLVFDQVTSPEALTAWWSPVTGSGLTGGELRFPMVAGQPPLLVRVDEATRPSTVRWTVIECTFMQDWVGTQPEFHDHCARRRLVRTHLRAPRPERGARVQGYVQPQLESLRRYQPAGAGRGRPRGPQSQPARPRPPRRRRGSLRPGRPGTARRSLPVAVR